MSISSSPRCAGIDIGSRSIELVILQNGVVVDSGFALSGSDPLQSAATLLADRPVDSLVATGYGRHLLELSCDARTVTEIKAYAEGARRVCPEARTILDIGGQDVKAISLDENGRVRKFEMNDRCAAGSGKFLEIMANRLDYALEEFGERALEAVQEISISSMCTVFAESEVTSLLHKGAPRPDIALAVHRSVVKRAVGMLNRVQAAPPIVFAGGGALNPCTRSLLEQELREPLFVPESPHRIGALGAALIAARSAGS
jgi:predicted CoA-substrate-specific enzyme activase